MFESRLYRQPQLARFSIAVATNGNALPRWAHLRTFVVALAATLVVLAVAPASVRADSPPRPNILFCISDDQSYPHASAYGYPAVETPAFDLVAKTGMLMTNAFCGSPGCSPSRASLLTGRYPWMIEHAGTHASEFPKRYEVYPDLLEQAGYFVGYTGKGWGPGNWKISGRERNPAGPAYSKRTLDEPPTGGVSRNDYAGNFADFLMDCPADKPFCFWYGASEPHRGFEKGSGLKAGKKLEDALVPPFLPDVPEVRSDILDYCLEIEHFDTHLDRMLAMLNDRGQLENTLVVVTSDNGMAFPRAKANCYEYGIHMPMAIAWPAGFKGVGVSDKLVSFVDLAPTFLEAAGLQPLEGMVGHSLLPLLRGEPEEFDRDAVYSARERHSSSRYRNLAYPQRAIRTQEYLLIRNFQPERWPAGAPRKYNDDGTLGPMHGGYHDIDSSPTLSFLIDHAEDPAIAKYLRWAVEKRPAIELFAVQHDPGCLNNLADDAAYRQVREGLTKQLNDYLRKTNDPRELDGGDIFETYKRYSPIRSFPSPEQEQRGAGEN